jgi:hypothetical protein
MSIAVDLDGTLAHYDHWRGAHHIGAPIPLMVARVKEWLAQGKEVVIFTARITPHPDFPSEVNRAGAGTDRIQDWLEAQGLPRLPVTNIKSPRFDEFWDDRAVSVQPNTGRINMFRALEVDADV